MQNRLKSFLALSAFLISATAYGQDWPQWRGPGNNGISASKGLPATWSKTENVAWRVELPGPGGATPCLWGDTAFVTSTSGNDLVLVAVDIKAGKIKWQTKVSEGDKVVRGDEGNAASPSPSTDGKHVWVNFSNGALACLDYQGKIVWSVNLQERFGQFKIAFGMTSTPILDGDRLYLQLIHGEGNAKTREATIACLDKVTGKTLWKTGRPSEAHSENEHSYASPVLYRDTEQEFLLTHGADYIVAHDLKTGDELWRCGGLHPPAGYDPTLRFVSSPAVAPGIIIVPSAKRGITLALKPGGKGDLTEQTDFHLWKFDITPDVPSPLILNGIVYLCRENGNLIALDEKTGEQFYEARTNRDRHRASPVYADGKIFLSGRNGVVSVCKPGEEFELLGQNSLEEPLSASPAIAGNRIYLRTFNAFYAIGK